MKEQPVEEYKEEVLVVKSDNLPIIVYFQIQGTPTKKYILQESISKTGLILTK